MFNAIMLSTFQTLAATVGSLSLPAHDWALPLPAEAVARNRPLAEMVQRVDRQAGGVLRVRHAGGDTDSRRAEVLRDALVALGLPSARIRLVPAAAPKDELIIDIAENGETGP